MLPIEDSTPPAWSILRLVELLTAGTGRREAGGVWSAVFGGWSMACGRGWQCGEMAELEGREPIIITPPQLSQHSKGIHPKEQFSLVERRKRVRRYDTTQLGGSTSLCGSTESRTERVGSKAGNNWVCKSLDNEMRWYDEMRCKLRYKMRWESIYHRVSRIYTPVGQPISVTPASLYAAITQPITLIPVSQHTHRRSVLCQAGWRWRWEPDFPATADARNHHVGWFHSLNRIYSDASRPWCWWLQPGFLQEGYTIGSWGEQISDSDFLVESTACFPPIVGICVQIWGWQWWWRWWWWRWWWHQWWWSLFQKYLGM